jgi:phosphomannomutase
MTDPSHDHLWQAVIEMVRRRLDGKGDLGELLNDLHEAKEGTEYRIRITDTDFKPIGAKALAAFKEYVEGGEAGSAWSLEKVNHEGWRVNIDEGEGRWGWLLLRQSLHDPLLVVNIESEVQGGCKEGAKKLLAFFSSACSGMPLDLSKLSV